MFKREIETKIIINASKEEVWRVLSGFDSYKDWNPFMNEIKGNFTVDSSINVKALLFSKVPMNFKAKIICIKEYEEFKWEGKFLVDGLFTGFHYFKLEENKNFVILYHGEKFSGILVPLFLWMINKTKIGFILMNKALKKRVEDK